MSDILKEVKEFALILGKSLKRYKPSKEVVSPPKEEIKVEVETKAEAEVDEDKAPYNTEPWIEINLLERGVDTIALEFTPLIKTMPSQLLFLQGEEEIQPFDLVSKYITKISYLSKVTPEVLRDWCSKYSEKYWPSMLWLTMHKFDNDKTINMYYTEIQSLNKGIVPCKFSDLPDQGRTLN